MEPPPESPTAKTPRPHWIIKRRSRSKRRPTATVRPPGAGEDWHRGGPIALDRVQHRQRVAVAVLDTREAAGHHQRPAAPPKRAARVREVTEIDLVLVAGGFRRSSGVCMVASTVECQPNLATTDVAPPYYGMGITAACWLLRPIDSGSGCDMGDLGQGWDIFVVASTDQ